MNDELESLVARLKKITDWKYPENSTDAHFLLIIMKIWENREEELKLRVERLELEKKEKLDNSRIERFITYFMDKSPKIFFFLRKIQYRYGNTKNNR